MATLTNKNSVLVDEGDGEVDEINSVYFNNQ